MDAPTPKWAAAWPWVGHVALGNQPPASLRWWTLPCWPNNPENADHVVQWVDFWLAERLGSLNQVTFEALLADHRGKRTPAGEPALSESDREAWQACLSRLGERLSATLEATPFSLGELRTFNQLLSALTAFRGWVVQAAQQHNSRQWARHHYREAPQPTPALWGQLADAFQALLPKVGRLDHYVIACPEGITLKTVIDATRAAEAAVVGNPGRIYPFEARSGGHCCRECPKGWNSWSGFFCEADERLWELPHDQHFQRLAESGRENAESRFRPLAESAGRFVPPSITGPAPVAAWCGLNDKDHAVRWMALLHIASRRPWSVLWGLKDSGQGSPRLQVIEDVLLASATACRQLAEGQLALNGLPAAVFSDAGEGGYARETHREGMQSVLAASARSVRGDDRYSRASLTISASQEVHKPHELGARKQKRSTERGEGRAKLIAALTKHHEYADGGCLNLEPVGNNKLAEMAKVAPSTASAFFNREFNHGKKGGYAKYRAKCRDVGTLNDALKALRGEFTPAEIASVTLQAFEAGKRSSDEE